MSCLKKFPKRCQIFYFPLLIPDEIIRQLCWLFPIILSHPNFPCLNTETEYVRYIDLGMDCSQSGSELNSTHCYAYTRKCHQIMIGTPDWFILSVNFCWCVSFATGLILGLWFQCISTDLELNLEPIRYIWLNSALSCILINTFQRDFCKFFHVL